MKSFVILLIVIMLSVTIVSGQAYAQDPIAEPTIEAPQPPELPTELPDTAEGVIPYLREWLLFVSALIATHVMNAFKKIPGLGQQEWLGKLVTELVSGVTASVVAFVLGLGAVGLGFLDESGLWQVILFAWPAAVGIYHGKKFSKANSKFQATAITSVK